LWPLKGPIVKGKGKGIQNKALKHLAFTNSHLLEILMIGMPIILIVFHVNLSYSVLNLLENICASFRVIQVEGKQ